MPGLKASIHQARRLGVSPAHKKFLRRLTLGHKVSICQTDLLGDNPTFMRSSQRHLIPKNLFGLEKFKKHARVEKCPEAVKARKGQGARKG